MIAYLSIETIDHGRFFLNADAFGFSQERIAQLVNGYDDKALAEINASLRTAAFKLEHAEPLGTA